MAEQLTFKCPCCQGLVAVPDALAGLATACPHCQAPIRVPRPAPGKPESSPPKTPADPGEVQTPSRPRTWTPASYVIAALPLAVLAVALLIAAWQAFGPSGGTLKIAGENTPGPRLVFHEIPYSNPQLVGGDRRIWEGPSIDWVQFRLVESFSDTGTDLQLIGRCQEWKDRDSGQWVPMGWQEIYYDDGNTLAGLRNGRQIVGEWMVTDPSGRVVERRRRTPDGSEWEVLDADQP